MRKWLIASSILLVLIVVAFIALLNVNALIARNKGYLIEQAEGALGRKISVDQVQATIFSGIGARLTNFAMADDPAYASGDFVRAKDLQVIVKFWQLLSSLRDTANGRLVESASRMSASSWRARSASARR